MMLASQTSQLIQFLMDKIVMFCFEICLYSAKMSCEGRFVFTVNIGH